MVDDPADVELLPDRALLEQVVLHLVQHALVQPAVRVHPRSGHYQGHDSINRGISFGYHQGEVFNFHIGGHNYVHSINVRFNQPDPDFVYSNGEAEVHIEGAWTSEGTVKGSVFTHGHGQKYYTAHVEIPNP